MTNNDLQNTTEKDRHYDGQKITDKRTNNDLQNTTEKYRHYNGQKITDKRTNNDIRPSVNTICGRIMTGCRCCPSVNTICDRIIIVSILE
jgi:hypothetical protein